MIWKIPFISIVVIFSLIRNFIRLSSDAIDGLDLAVKKMIENAVARCQANKRKTVIKEDF
jgi:histone H3/H4